MLDDPPREQQERMSPGRIRSAVYGALEDIGWTPGIATKDTDIVRGDLKPVLDKLSKRIGYQVVLGPPRRGGRRFNVSSLTSFVYENLHGFDPLPPEQPEEQTQNLNSKSTDRL